jgi:hypothetical protein
MNNIFNNIVFLSNYFVFFLLGFLLFIFNDLNKLRIKKSTYIFFYSITKQIITIE